MNPFSWRRRAGPRPEVEAEIDEELGFHLERSRRELEAGGAMPEEAEARARERFGDVARVRRQCIEIANGEQTMIRNILLAASLVVIVTLSVMCVHFYNVARAAKQEAIMQRMLAEQEMQKAQSMSGFLQQILVSAHPRAIQADVRMTPLLEATSAYIDRAMFTPEVEADIRAATRAAARSEEPGEDQ